MDKDSSIKSDTPLIFLSGPTAVGKTELSLQIAEQFSCEIIGVDSMQVYRFMDIGTAKPTAAERSRIPHHLIDIIDPDEDYTLGAFVRDAEMAIQSIYANKNTPLLTGGTGLYFKGLLKGVFDDFTGPEEKSRTFQEKNCVRQNLQKRLEEEGARRLHKELAELDPESARRIHPNDIQRILRGLEIFYTTGIPWSKHLASQSEKKSHYRVIKIGLTRPRKELYKRIDQRVQHMVEQGLLEEARNLLAMGFDNSLKSMQSIGYRHMINFIEGRWNWDETLELLARDTRHYAKRQYTWFRKDPEVIWRDVREPAAIFADIRIFLENNP